MRQHIFSRQTTTEQYQNTTENAHILRLNNIFPNRTAPDSVGEAHVFRDKTLVCSLGTQVELLLISKGYSESGLPETQPTETLSAKHGHLSVQLEQQQKMISYSQHIDKLSRMACRVITPRENIKYSSLVKNYRSEDKT